MSAIDYIESVCQTEIVRLKDTGLDGPFFGIKSMVPALQKQLIPLDDRTGKPLITNAMKAACIGEFSFEVERTCYSCHEIEVQEECEVCGGEVTYISKVVVPWTTCKEIYKAMAMVAVSEVKK